MWTGQTKRIRDLKFKISETRTCTDEYGRKHGRALTNTDFHGRFDRLTAGLDEVDWMDGVDDKNVTGLNVRTGERVSKKATSKKILKPNFKLVGDNGELLVAIGERSWHILDEDLFFKKGWLAREAFGLDFVAGLFKKPADGVLKTISANKLMLYCKDLWFYLMRDKDLLSYCYSYKFEREKGMQYGSGGLPGFVLRGFSGSVWTRPAGYCTLELMQASPSGKGRIVEIIDLRVIRKVQADDGRYLKVYRRKMEIDWYREMPRIMEFCEQNKNGTIKVVLVK
jgi:hypothetical protein